jgi:catechol 2,3-dioxygenase-like lactoylglutathione lyase family enzyme
MRVHHLAFRTDDIQKLERFYTDTVGLSLLHRTETGSVWLDAGGCVLMLERREAGEPKPDAASRDLVAFSVEPEHYAAYMERFARCGITLDGQTDFSIYLRDPDGRRIGLSSYPRRLR